MSAVAKSGGAYISASQLEECEIPVLYVGYTVADWSSTQRLNELPGDGSSIQCLIFR